MSQTLEEYILDLQLANRMPIGVQYEPFDMLKKVDYGLTGGAGIELKMGKEILTWRDGIILVWEMYSKVVVVRMLTSHVLHID